MASAPETQSVKKKQHFDQIENDFIPNNAPTQPQQQQQQQHEPPQHHNPNQPPATKQLDFYQAMADFKHMFPDMDDEIIEAVLRANHGAVDATIDQLLTMNVDNEEETFVKHKYKGPPIPPELLESSEDEEDAPPSYNQAIQNLEPSYPVRDVAPMRDRGKKVKPKPQPKTPQREYGGFSNETFEKEQGRMANGVPFVDYIPESFGGKPTTPPSTQRKSMFSTPPSSFSTPLPTSTSSALPLSSQRKSSSQTKSHPRSYRNWNPPLLGNLPEDFLRIQLTPEQKWGRGQQPQRPKQLSTPSQFSLPRPPPSGREMSDSVPLLNNQRMSMNGAISPQPQGGAKPKIRNTQSMTSADIRRKMEENEIRRSSLTGNSEAAQVLEDERVALILQNEEFLSELREDEDFMKTLERDRMNASAFELPSHDPSPLPQFQPQNASLAEDRKNMRELDMILEQTATRNAESVVPPDQSTPAPSVPVPNGTHTLEKILDESSPEHNGGYGEDQQKEMGAYPFSKPMEGQVDKNAELRKQLHHMGASSKKKFHAIAKTFFSRKKKKAKNILSEKSAPSRTNLLQDDGYEVLEEGEESGSGSSSRRKQDTTPEFEPLALAVAGVPQLKIVQRPPYHTDPIVFYQDDNKFDMI